jgi:glucose-1-phosphate cytidylyltransferase
MKVVLFCGGYGTRLREGVTVTPKPLVDIGYRPIIWYLMKHYAYYGHKQFILCLGYRGDLIKQYFLNYNEFLSSDLVIRKSGRDIELVSPDTEDWEVTLVETGLEANIGQRLMRVRQYLGDDPVFMANYSDGLSDIDMHRQLELFQRSGAVASFAAVHPRESFSMVDCDEQGWVRGISYMEQADLRINGGFMILKREIFDHMEPGDELVEAPFQRLIAKRALAAYKHDGFWAAMDTFRDKKRFDDMYARGETPWKMW